jgi:hypothetical protein
MVAVGRLKENLSDANSHPDKALATLLPEVTAFQLLHQMYDRKCDPKIHPGRGSSDPAIEHGLVYSFHFSQGS